MILPTAFLVVYQRQRHRQRSALIGTEYSAQITIQDFDGVIDTHFVLNILKRYDILKKNFLIKNVIEQPGPVITGQVPAVTGQVPVDADRHLSRSADKICFMSRRFFNTRFESKNY
jgi:hypothetical protein